MTPLRVAVLSENEDDDAIAREIVAAVRGAAVEPVGVRSLRDRGKPAVLRQVDLVLRTVYYHTDADALVVLADNDLDEVHDPRTHAVAPSVGCGWCALDRALSTALTQLTPRAGRAPLFTAVGCPVPALEAWLLAGTRPEASEAAWLQRGPDLAAGAPVYLRRLKQHAYGSEHRLEDRPAIARGLIRRALATPGLLRAAFPGGYSPLEDAIRAWPR